MYNLPENKSLDIKIFSNILDLKLTTTSYKLYWFYGILEEVKHGNKIISFKTIVENMVCKTWYSILEFKLKLGHQDQLGNIVRYLYENHNIEKSISEKELKKRISKIDTKEYKAMFNKMFNLVPYRLLSPFYEELKGQKDSIKNKMIVKLSNENTNGIYKINNEIIEVNKNWFEYLYKHQVIVEGWIKYKLVNYLQTKNPSVPAIMFKLEAPQKRNLNKATTFWKELIQNYEIRDIYTNEILSIDNLSIDHFIPWSFVLHDELWNLVPTTRNINSSKNARLPNLEEYLDRLIDILYFAFIKTIESGKIKLLEDYLNINELELVKIPREVFSELLKNTLKPLHQLATNQGFLEWKRN